MSSVRVLCVRERGSKEQSHCNIPPPPPPPPPSSSPGFAELQTDLDELTGDISGHRLPYHDLKVS